MVERGSYARDGEVDIFANTTGGTCRFSDVTGEHMVAGGSRKQGSGYDILSEDLTYWKTQISSHSLGVTWVDARRFHHERVG